MKKMMFKIVFSLVMCLLLTSTIICADESNADEYAIFGGIKRDEFASKKGTFVYEEMCFMTKEPVLLRGTVVIPKIPDADTYSFTIKYDLANAEKNIKLERSVTYDVVKEKDEEVDQVITNWTIKNGGIKETVDIAGEVYELRAFDFDNSIFTDLKPAGDFVSGNLHYKKVFTTEPLELDKGKKITITGDSLTYDSNKNIWSGASTLVVEQKIVYEDLPSFKMQKEIGPLDEGASEQAGNGWQGIVKYTVSSKLQSKFDNVKSIVKNTSFRKGLLKSTNNEYNVEYDYNLPGKELVLDNAENNTGTETEKKAEPAQNKQVRNKGKISLESYKYDHSTRLNIPKYNDIAGHWAEESIFKMASLGAFDLNESFFPDVNITRAQFARAILNSIDSVDVESEEVRRTEFIKSKRANGKKPLFTDVRRDSEYYIFVKGVYERKIMLGEGSGQFLPNRPLTRQEAITTMMRAFGVNDVAPALPFASKFIDEDEISAWAKPSIYQAVDLGIIKGYDDGTIKPLKHVTKAEVSTMLAAFIEHLRKEVPKDYIDYLSEDY